MTIFEPQSLLFHDQCKQALTDRVYTGLTFSTMTIPSDLKSVNRLDSDVTNTLEYSCKRHPIGLSWSWFVRYFSLLSIV